MFKDIPKNPSGYGMELTSEEIEQAVAEIRGAQMNNLQHIVKDNTRFAMHMAVELCERGDFDSVNEALRWLMKERDDVATPSGGECEVEETEWLIYGGEGCDTYRHTLSCGHVSETFDEEPPNFCCECGAKVKAVC